MNAPLKTVKSNVSRFDEDVRRTGSYAYTAEKLSSRYANDRISESIAAVYPFASKRVLDLGCGDGTYTMEFPALGVREILGIDPAKVAVESANRKAAEAGLDSQVRFKVGNIYEPETLLEDGRFDCVVLRGVLHHLPDPAKAIQCAASLADTIIILEPNGCNPVLKLLERFSRYHVEHEEQSFLPGTISSWLGAAKFRVQTMHHLNLVPMFCPDWMARLCKSVEPVVEKVPLLRQIACGQCIILATKA
ncbi:class I SAM-dependent methyltransferase [Noviherbaspirillum cavernae]|uniref:Class I SAM-dependent methyltransferase n=1 Tax=Noviherbaspirillum cavernae TaxID=2320862 RepID=A0A418WWN6_9BURK|nr:class I SAM-dependent methyltransferase [Noviherbaspirillum cavernae]RJG04656.1 class I SAM-dependent methyltransferase [Noviherbaspirillum cavernae]